MNIEAVLTFAVGAWLGYAVASNFRRTGRLF